MCIRDSNGDRQVSVLEADELLPDAVFGDLEVFLLQIGNQAVVAVEHRAVEHHLIDLGVQNVALALFSEN